jgi:outer membrane immunogenic protein
MGLLKRLRFGLAPQEETTMRLHKLLFAALAASTAAGSALAADLPSRKEAPVYIAPAPVFTWTGFYVGLNAGYGWLGSYNRANYVTHAWTGWGWAPGYGPVGGNGNGGFVGGGQIGYNYQISPMFVVGLEADFQGSSIGHGGGYWGGGVNRSVDWFGTLRGRVGVTLFNPQLLVYGTGGFAFGDMRLTNLWGGYAPRTTATGWTAGGGLEWAFTPNWSAKVEYLFTNIGSSNWGGYNPRVERVHINTVRAGVNYRFNWGGSAPVVAKY